MLPLVVGNNEQQVSQIDAGVPMEQTTVRPTTAELLVLTDVLHTVARSHRLSIDDEQEFAQAVQLRMLERNYDVFAQFAGRSSLKTYLTVVVTRLMSDWRRSRYGNWRPSVAAVRLGSHAVFLEKLIARDGCKPHEAVQIARARPESPSAAALGHLASRLPVRYRRRMVDVDFDTLVGDTFNDPIEAEERRRTARKVRAALTRALDTLPAEDRWLIDMRFARAHSVQTIGRIERTDPKPLYRRLNRVLRDLRHTLVASGITAAAAMITENRVTPHRAFSDCAVDQRIATSHRRCAFC